MDEQLEFEYVTVEKAIPIKKKFALTYGELKHICDSLEDFNKRLEMLIEKSEGAYDKARFKKKLEESKSITEKIETEIKYCAKCRVKNREETGFDGITAATMKF